MLDYLRILRVYVGCVHDTISASTISMDVPSIEGLDLNAWEKRTLEQIVERVAKEARRDELRKQKEVRDGRRRAKA